VFVAERSIPAVVRQDEGKRQVHSSLRDEVVVIE
jgi:hypothetical protein